MSRGGPRSQGSGFGLPYGKLKNRNPVDQPDQPPSQESPSSDSNNTFFLEIIDALKQIEEQLGPTQRQNFYNISAIISTYGTAQTSALREDSSDYIRETIFEHIGMNAPVLNIVNDGPGTWYIRHSHDGQNFSDEWPLYEGEAITYRNIYELRHRAPLATLKYRITEYALSKMKNVDFKAGRGYVRNQVLAVGNADPVTAYATADTHSFFTSIQRNATTGYIKNLDNSAILYVWVSEDGTEYGQSGSGLAVEYITIQPLSVFHIDGWSIHTVKVGSDSNAVQYEIVGG